jgi:FkbM family methyltransferase
VAAGGKYDFTNKWWDPKRYQQVIDYFRKKILFVQVGSADHHHPPLEGVIDLRGRTDLRQLVRLVLHSQGVLCPVTLFMHLAAAVPAKAGSPITRPCVVVAGGREPSHWEAYPHHQFIHTIGALPCCETGGCWKSRVVALGDGDEKDRPQNLCVNVVGNLPKCMDMITADEVIRRIGLYFMSGLHRYLEAEEANVSQPLQAVVWPALSEEYQLTEENALAVSEAVIQTIPPYPEHYQGTGIVICAGGVKYFTNAWVCINMLRALGCKLPVQIWHLGKGELDDTMKELMARFDVECVDAELVRQKCPSRMLDGWELKPYTIIQSPFREVLLIDADNLPLVKPEELFELDEYHQTGAVFWPDYGRLGPHRPIWKICGVSYRMEPEFETGQILINKEKCWDALMLTMWYNANSDFYYRYVHGDKETFHMAFRKLNRPYAMTSRRIVTLNASVMCQHDFRGKRIFQHRNMAKWELTLENRHIPGFFHESECRAFVQNLAKEWSGVIKQQLRCPKDEEAALTLKDNVYRYSRVGGDSREITFNADGTIGRGSASLERSWDLRREADGRIFLEIFGEGTLTCALLLCRDGIWRGRWRQYEKAEIEVSIKSERERREGTTDGLIWQQVYEENAYRLPPRFRPDDIILDIGAHIGAFSCACIARGAKYVYGYEPDKENFALALLNTRRWFHIHNPREKHNPSCLENIAIWRSDKVEDIAVGKYTVSPDPSGLIDTGATETSRGGTECQACKSIGLDVVLNELPKVTLMKLHCEGAEWPILLTSRALAKVERVIVKLHTRKSTNANSPSSQSLIPGGILEGEFLALVGQLQSAGLIFADEQPYLEGNGVPRHGIDAAKELGPFYFHRLSS